MTEKAKNYWCVKDHKGNLKWRTLRDTSNTENFVFINCSWEDMQESGFTQVKVEFNEKGKHPSTIKVKKLIGIVKALDLILKESGLYYEKRKKTKRFRTLCIAIDEVTKGD